MEKRYLFSVYISKYVVILVTKLLCVPLHYIKSARENQTFLLEMAEKVLRFSKDKTLHKVLCLKAVCLWKCRLYTMFCHPNTFHNSSFVP